MNKKSVLWSLASLLVLASMLLSACGAPATTAAPAATAGPRNGSSCNSCSSHSRPCYCSPCNGSANGDSGSRRARPAGQLLSC